MKTKNYILMILMTILILPFTLATCSYSSYTDGGSDYFGVNSTTTSTTVMASNQTFGSYLFFTPRLNFTVVVNGTYTGGETGSSSILLWKTPLNISSSFQLYDADTPTSPIDPSNYTLTQVGNVLNVTLKEGTWNNSLVFYKFNRTFIKNVEDLVTNASGIYTGATTSSFLTFAGGSTYGDDKTFTLNSASLGKYLENKNWAVGWSYTEKTCTDTGDCANPVNSVLYTVLVTIFMVGMLVFLAYSVKNGADGKIIIGIVVAFIIMLIGLTIINGMITGICAL